MLSFPLSHCWSQRKATDVHRVVPYILPTKSIHTFDCTYAQNLYPVAHAARVYKEHEGGQVGSIIIHQNFARICTPLHVF